MPCKRLAEHRAHRVVAANGRAMVDELVKLLDRMLPDTPEELRATDEEWDALRVRAEEFLASGLTAEGLKTYASRCSAEGAPA